MAFPVTDFDNVTFNDGSGWAEVVAIHLAIKERADAVAHSLADGRYAVPWDTETPVFLGDPEDASPGDGRTYLRDVLKRFYDDIVLLLIYDADIRWVKTAGVEAEEWTEAEMVTDIGLGAFVDLLTKPANHLPFLWLHEALDRLIYARVTVPVTQTGTRTYKKLPPPDDAFGMAPDSYPGGLFEFENIWDAVRAESDSTDTAVPTVGYVFDPKPASRWTLITTTEVDGVSVNILDATTTVSLVEYRLVLTQSKYTLETTGVAVNGEVTNFAPGSSSGSLWVEGNTLDVDGGNNFEFNITLSTGIAADNPSRQPNGISYYPAPPSLDGARRITLSHVRGTYDLSSELSDQE